MSVARVFRYLVGLIISVIVLAVVLPFVGVPSSHFLPPAAVWKKAQGVTRGYITDKYYDVTNNPFNVGGRQYYIDYEFSAKKRTSPNSPPGPVQLYQGTIRADQDAFHSVAVSADPATLDKYVAQQKIPAVTGQIVRVQYEVSYPEINGVIAPTAMTARSIGPGSNDLSGWLIWVVAALVLGYFIMLLLERFGNKENI